MSELPHQLDRTIVIQATREVVFGFFTDTPRWAAWWGAGSSIEARPGGRVVIRYPNGTEAAGDVVEVHAPERIAFTYGYASGTPIPVGASRVTIRLESDVAGTRVHLTHKFADAAVRDQHVQGWRYQLSLFSNVAADEVNAGASGLADAWFDAWAEPDAVRRESALAQLVSDRVRFHDRFSNTAGLADLNAHITASQYYMPGLRLHRAGDVRHCQGMVLVDWVMRGTDGQDKARGTNVFVAGPTGRIDSVTGFLTPP